MLNFDRRQKHLLSRALMSFGGAAYFALFSQLNVHFLLKGYVMIIPLQILALFYVLYVKNKEYYDAQKSSH